jgi:hypothetical protein
MPDPHPDPNPDPLVGRHGSLDPDPHQNVMDPQHGKLEQRKKFDTRYLTRFKTFSTKIIRPPQNKTLGGARALDKKTPAAKSLYRSIFLDDILLAFYQGCGSAFISSGSGSSILGWTPIRIRIQGFKDQKLKKKYS